MYTLPTNPSHCSTCKPEPEYYAMAMQKASLDPTSPADRAKCLFVDDSLSNARAAHTIPWRSSVWFRERLTPAQRAHLVSGDEAGLNNGQTRPLTEEEVREKIERVTGTPSGSYAEQLQRVLEGGDGKDTEGVDAVISSLHELREVWSFIFRGSSLANSVIDTSSTSSTL